MCTLHAYGKSRACPFCPYLSARYKVFSDPLVCALLLACLLALGLASAREREKRETGRWGGSGGKEGKERDVCVRGEVLELAR